MAMRIDGWVVRGEVDNRHRGFVYGRIWLAGRSEPVLLELAGNCGRDLAGCLLTFARKSAVSPTGLAPGRGVLAPVQTGVVGTLTASRKVRVPADPDDGPPDAPGSRDRAGSALANAVYLEWYSRENGRVLLETVDCDLMLSEHAWSMSASEEAVEANENARRVVEFLEGCERRGEREPDAPPES